MGRDAWLSFLNPPGSSRETRNAAFRKRLSQRAKNGGGVPACQTYWGGQDEENRRRLLLIQGGGKSEYWFRGVEGKRRTLIPQGLR